MADIGALEKYEPFQRYWMRRLRQRHAEMSAKFLREAMSHEMREVTRCQILLMEEFLGLTKVDLNAASREAATPPPEAVQRPVQVG